MLANVDKLTRTVDDILIRMKEMEKKLTTSSTYTAGESTGNVCPLPTSDPPHQPEKSFASLATDIAASKSSFSFKKIVCGLHQAANSSIKVVPESLSALWDGCTRMSLNSSCMVFSQDRV